MLWWLQEDLPEPDITTLKDELSPLHCSIVEERLDLLGAQLEDPKIDINIYNKNLETPLFAATMLKNTKLACEMVKKLLEAKADPNISNSNGETPLHVAVKRDNSLVKLLLSFDSNINARNDLGESPLHIAKSAEIVRELIHHGAEVNLLDTSGNSALHKQVNSMPICEALIEHGADMDIINVNGFSPLHSALLKCAQETALFLLENGASVGSIEKDEVSALDLAYLKHCTNRIKDLCWRRSRPAYLLLVENYESTRRDDILKVWNRRITNDKLLAFLLELVDLLEDVPMFRWVPPSQLVADFFLSKISVLTYNECQCFLRKFSNYLHFSVLNFILRTLDYTDKYILYKIETLIELLLSKGEVLDFSDIEIIFFKLGDCFLIHKLLKLAITDRTRKCADLPLFLRLLCDVTLNPTTFIKNYYFSRTNVYKLYSLHNLSRYYTFPKFLATEFDQNYESIVQSVNPELGTEEMDECVRKIVKNRAFPTLQELARNVARPTLAQRYNVQSTKDMYTLLDQLELPKRITSIIMMEFPLYLNKIPSYESYKKYCVFL